MNRHNPPLSASLNWLTLGQAAQLLGVHPNTLRRWADDGDIHCTRTPGGHRRFREVEILAFLSGQSDQPKVETSPSPGILTSFSVHRTCQKMQAQRETEASWRSAFDDSERAVRRESGRQLLELAIQYISRTTGREAFLEKGCCIGREYGRDAAGRDLSLAETTQALLFFREALVCTARSGFLGQKQCDDHIHHSLQEFLDEIFCATMDAYEQTLCAQMTSGSS